MYETLQPHWACQILKSVTAQLKETQNKYGLFGRVASRKCLNKPQDSWANILWTNETKVELFGLN